MDNKPFDNTEKQGGGVAAGKTYSAQELGELMNTNPGYLFKHIDIGRQTDWYTNYDFMEEMLSYVHDEVKINALIDFLIVKQEYQVTYEHHPKVCYRVTDERKYAPFVDDLPARLDSMRVRILHSREVCIQLELMKNQWSESDQTGMSTGQGKNEATTTVAPNFKDETNINSINPQPEFHMDDFDQNKISCLLIYDDETFSVFVKTMREKLWPAVEKNKNKYSNLLRFLLMFHEIVARKTSMPAFDIMLQAIIPGIGTQLSSLKQRQDCNKMKNLDYYGDSKQRKNSSCWEITHDAPYLEKHLKPLIEKMTENEDG